MYRRATLAMVVSSTSMNVGMTTATATIQGLIAVRRSVVGASDKLPLFVGLSVTPYVYYKEPPTGPHAGDVLQPLSPLPEASPEPKP